MGIGNVFVMVIDNADERQWLEPLPIIIWVLREAEHPGRSHVIARNRKIHQKIARKEVPPESVGLLVGEYEDVRERRGGIADVHPLVEGVEQLAYPSIDDGGIIIVAGPGGAGVHRCEVRLVIDDQKRDAWDRSVRTHRTQ